LFAVVLRFELLPRVRVFFSDIVGRARVLRLLVAVCPSFTDRRPTQSAAAASHQSSAKIQFLTASANSFIQQTGKNRPPLWRRLHINFLSLGKLSC